GAVISLEGVCEIRFVEADDEPDVLVAKAGEGHVETVASRAPDQVAGEAPDTDPGTLLRASPLDLAGEVTRLEALARKQAQRLNLLYQLGKSLSSVFSLDDIYRRVSDVLFEVT